MINHKKQEWLRVEKFSRITKFNDEFENSRLDFSIWPNRYVAPLKSH